MAVFNVDQDKVKGWLSKGAIPSDVVRKYLGKTGILPAVDISQNPNGYRAKKRKNKEEAAKAKEAAAAAKKEKDVSDKKAVEEKVATDKKAAEDKEAADKKPRQSHPPPLNFLRFRFGGQVGG